MNGEVVGLGAWCEFVPEGESPNSPGSVSFDVHEFALPADGRRITLHQGERGFSVSEPRVRSGHPLGDLSATDIESGVRTTVLPDHDDGEEHPWEWLAELLRSHGVSVSARSLKVVPYTVEFGDRLQRLLGLGGHL